MNPIRLGYAWLPESATAAEPEPLLRLLQALADTGDLQAAARSLESSYRHAWGLLERWERTLGRQLAIKTRGRGTSLTAFGLALLDTDRRVRECVAPHFARAAAAAQRELAGALAPKPRALRIVASHDLALERLRDHFAAAGGPHLDLAYRGSADCLQALSRGECDVAGFHIAAPASGRRAAKLRIPVELARFLDPARHRLYRFAERQQGLLVRAGNPKHIAGVSDLTRRGTRFINRQRGSGTRLEFDHLLQVQRVDPSRIQGYGREEFTHSAVAATVAAGEADAGFGIRAAAAPLGLAFVPIVAENYLLAAHRDSGNEPEWAALLAALKRPGTRRMLAALPGYRFAGSGTPVAAWESDRA